MEKDIVSLDRQEWWISVGNKPLSHFYSLPERDSIGRTVEPREKRVNPCWRPVRK